ncbi:ferric uptake regulator [Lactobacillus pasteurii DSM 23907 = CRBIP 24.76]|uniref:Ferric uptake regulation protein n=1 Tax=Lactobacillus pasteurii DSM 23907 = CRBIP 24.76 TaxID=1423790 RepID=I7J0T9_9LACO|nr:Fur family transcriptional regulator [Lactobacillus pasteurii]KRK08791.1 ferric uptake regulator [Lactobacillus pasteurii DSM 23907 = CRBIP 24.76]TDG76374.1 hypothetical protein C5L33_001133 [Lactobacillus pasteurii]CCI85902.1 Ferric uptake regulation protein [Lactobacillus pasteurii DSM 23907 = CRBIP 24.76]
MVDVKATDLLHQHNLKATKPRLRILNYLIENHNHPTADMIYKDLSQETDPLNRATVYNTLNSLIAVGIVIEIKNGDNSSHYDFFVEPHFHIICKSCGRIADVYYPHFDEIEDTMRSNAEKQTGFKTSSSHLEIFGLCPDCQQKEASR